MFFDGLFGFAPAIFSKTFSKPSRDSSEPSARAASMKSSDCGRWPSGGGLRAGMTNSSDCVGADSAAVSARPRIVRRHVPRDINLRRAFKTLPASICASLKPRASVWSEIENALFPLLKACGTKPMRWFGAAHRWLYHKSERSNVNSRKFMLLLICVPCGKSSNFFFKFAYRLNQRHALFIRQKHAALNVNNFRLQFDPLFLKGCSVAQSNHRLSDILHNLERGHRSRNRCDVYQEEPPTISKLFVGDHE